MIMVGGAKLSWKSRKAGPLGVNICGDPLQNYLRRWLSAVGLGYPGAVGEVQSRHDLRGAVGWSGGKCSGLRTGLAILMPSIGPQHPRSGEVGVRSSRWSSSCGGHLVLRDPVLSLRTSRLPKGS